MTGLRAFTATLLLTATAVFSFTSPASAAAPNPDDVFTFDQTLQSSTTSTVLTPYGACPTPPTATACNSNTGFGTGGGDSYWEWSSDPTTYATLGGGFTFPSTNLTGTYTFQMKFQIMTPASGNELNRLVEYKGLTLSDFGLYLADYEGPWDLYEYNLGRSGLDFSFDVTDVIEVAIARDGTTSTLRAFLRSPISDSFIQVFELDDPSGEATPENVMGFFADQGDVVEAVQAGRIYDLRFWNETALTASQLNAELMLSYDANGATSGSVPEATLAAGAQTVAANSGNLVKPGFQFGGWNTQADGKGTMYGPGSSLTPSDDVTLYAMWTAVLATTGSGYYRTVTLCLAVFALLTGAVLFVTTRRSRLLRADR